MEDYIEIMTKTEVEGEIASMISYNLVLVRLETGKMTNKQKTNTAASPTQSPPARRRCGTPGTL